jgi:hypothetical protein
MSLIGIAHRSVHNIRIERLWVDVTAQLGASWAEVFTALELHHGLNINNTHHIWLLHFLFLPMINQQLSFFAESWNQHRMQIRGGPNRSPADMFGFDMFVHGIRGDQLPPADDITAEELEVFGIDWAAFREERVLQSLRENAPAQEEATSWIGHTGPPAHLNEVPLDAPAVAVSADQLQPFQDSLELWMHTVGENVTVESLWVYGLALAQQIYGNDF